jgi:hypothetical protein
LKPRVYIFLLAALLFFYSCANIVPPTGGPEDRTPPALLSTNPADSQLNAKPRVITLKFDKYMVVKDLEKSLTISPLMNINPSVQAWGKSVEITFIDTQFIAATTYTLSLGNALTDNRESTPYANFTYTFSTGSYFDSLQLRGTVINALLGSTDTSGLIGLYAADADDSVVIKKKPIYVTKLRTDGTFSFSSLPDKAFRLIAISDENNNYMYDRGTEAIGFLNHTVRPTVKADTSYTLYSFKEALITEDTATHAEIIDTANSKKSLKPTAGQREKPKATSNKNDLNYVVGVDTNALDKGIFELNQKLNVHLYHTISTLDSNKVYLSYDNGGIETEAIKSISLTDTALIIKCDWVGDTKYTLRLIKGWAKDSLGNDWLPGKYPFKTKKLEAYGTLKINIPVVYQNSNHLLFVTRGNDTLYHKTIETPFVALTLLEPDNYQIRIINDQNKNGYWDAGNYFQGLQPETVLPHHAAVVIKAGWDNEVDFSSEKISSKPKAGAGKVIPKEAIPPTPK